MWRIEETKVGRNVMELKKSAARQQLMSDDRLSLYERECGHEAMNEVIRIIIEVPAKVGLL